MTQADALSTTQQTEMMITQLQSGMIMLLLLALKL